MTRAEERAQAVCEALGASSRLVPANRRDVVEATIARAIEAAEREAYENAARCLRALAATLRDNDGPRGKADVYDDAAERVLRAQVRTRAALLAPGVEPATVVEGERCDAACNPGADSVEAMQLRCRLVTLYGPNDEAEPATVAPVIDDGPRPGDVRHDPLYDEPHTLGEPFTRPNEREGRWTTEVPMLTPTDDLVRTWRLVRRGDGQPPAAEPATAERDAERAVVDAAERWRAALDSALATLRDAAKGGERARIVAWLRRQNEGELDVRARCTTEAYAQRIERGEYEET